jgi:hypothetical protein
MYVVHKILLRRIIAVEYVVLFPELLGNESKCYRYGNQICADDKIFNFNHRLSQARRVSDNACGILSVEEN